MTKNKRSTVRVPIYIDIDGLKFEDVISQLTNAFNSVPEQYRKTAYVSLDVYESYGDVTLDQFVVYHRDETDEEMNARIKRENDWEARRIADAKKLLGIKE